MLSEYSKVLICLVGGILFVVGGMLLSKLLAPNRPSIDKLTPYECGELPVGTAWTQFNMRFYVMGLIFLIFDAEILLLFPWATVYSKIELIQAQPNWGIFTVVEAFIFIFILAIGLVYIWAKGDINWVKPQTLPPTTLGNVPLIEYQKFNLTQTNVSLEKK